MSAKSVLDSSIMSNVIAGLIVAGIIWYVGKKAAGSASDAISDAVKSAKDFGASVGNDLAYGSKMVVQPWADNYDPAWYETAANGARLIFMPWYVTDSGQSAIAAQTATTITSEGKIQ